MLSGPIGRIGAIWPKWHVLWWCCHDLWRLGLLHGGQLRCIFGLHGAHHPTRARLQLHLALARLIFCGTWDHWVVVCTRRSLHGITRICTVLLLVRHNVSGEYSLLCLLSFYLECCERTQLVVHAARGRILTRAHRMVLIPVHGWVHRIVLYMFLHLRTVVAAIL